MHQMRRLHGALFFIAYLAAVQFAVPFNSSYFATFAA